MTYIIAVLGIMLLSMVLWDAFVVIILPRRVWHYVGFARVFYRSTWRPWSAVAPWMRDDQRRETYLSIFGPLSLLLLLGVWATGLVAGFAMVHRGLGTPLNVAPGSAPFSTYLYLSGTTFFTLGLGDVTPLGPLGRALSVARMVGDLLQRARRYRPQVTGDRPCAILPCSSGATFRPTSSSTRSAGTSGML
jgi:hypothetical protein